MPEFRVLPEATRRDGIMAKAEWHKAEINSRKTAVISCPGCGKIAPLSVFHTIADNGDVFPSLVCSFDCGLHEFVRLGGWKE